MKESLKAIPDIVSAAAQNVFGLFALAIVLVSVVALILFRKSSAGERLFAFSTLAIGAALFLHMLFDWAETYLRIQSGY